MVILAFVNVPEREYNESETENLLVFKENHLRTFSIMIEEIKIKIKITPRMKVNAYKAPRITR